MPYTIFRNRVSAAPATIWAVLIDDLSKRIGEDFSDESSDAEQRGERIWKRTSATSDDVTIQEISANMKEMRITYSLVERRHYEGTNVSQIVAPHWRDPDRRLTLSMSMSWQPLNANTKEAEMRARLRDGVNRLKGLAEKLERRREIN